MDKAINTLLAFLFVVGSLGYLYGIFKACWITLQKNPVVTDMPAFLSSIITSIGAVLATNLGAVLGIAITNPASEYAVEASNPIGFLTNPSFTTVQIAACYIYVLVLVAVSIVWGMKNFTTDNTKVVSNIPELTRTFLGVIIGVFAILLAKK